MASLNKKLFRLVLLAVIIAALPMAAKAILDDPNFLNPKNGDVPTLNPDNTLSVFYSAKVNDADNLSKMVRLKVDVYDSDNQLATTSYGNWVNPTSSPSEADWATSSMTISNFTQGATYFYYGFTQNQDLELSPTSPRWLIVPKSGQPAPSPFALVDQVVVSTSTSYDTSEIDVHFSTNKDWGILNEYFVERRIASSTDDWQTNNYTKNDNQVNLDALLVNADCSEEFTCYKITNPFPIINPGEEYVYRVRLVYSYGEGVNDYSTSDDGVSVTVASSPLKPVPSVNTPILLATSTDYKKSTILVQYTPPDTLANLGLSGFEIIRKDLGTGNEVTFFSALNFYSDNTAVPGTNYEYRVRMYYQSGIKYYGEPVAETVQTPSLRAIDQPIESVIEPLPATVATSALIFHFRLPSALAAASDNTINKYEIAINKDGVSQGTLQFFHTANNKKDDVIYGSPVCGLNYVCYSVLFSNNYGTIKLVPGQNYSFDVRLLHPGSSRSGDWLAGVGQQVAPALLSIPQLAEIKLEKSSTPATTTIVAHFRSDSSIWVNESGVTSEIETRIDATAAAYNYNDSIVHAKNDVIFPGQCSGDYFCYKKEYNNKVVPLLTVGTTYAFSARTRYEMPGPAVIYRYGDWVTLSDSPNALQPLVINKPSQVLLNNNTVGSNLVSFNLEYVYDESLPGIIRSLPQFSSEPVDAYHVNFYDASHGNQIQYRYNPAGAWSNTGIQVVNSAEAMISSSDPVLGDDPFEVGSSINQYTFQYFDRNNPNMYAQARSYNRYITANGDTSYSPQATIPVTSLKPLPETSDISELQAVRFGVENYRLSFVYNWVKSGPTRFAIEYKRSVDPTWSVASNLDCTVQPTSATPCSINLYNFEPDSEYDFRIMAVGQANQWGTFNNATRDPIPALNQPEVSRYQNYASSTITLKFSTNYAWSPNSAYTGYAVDQKINGGGYNPISGCATNSSSTNRYINAADSVDGVSCANPGACFRIIRSLDTSPSQIIADSAYTYRVRLCVNNHSGPSSTSSPITAYNYLAIPKPLNNQLSTSAGLNDSTITYSFRLPIATGQGVNYYHVDKSIDGGSTWSNATSTNSTNGNYGTNLNVTGGTNYSIDFKVLPSQNYCFRARFYYDGQVDNYGSYSDQVCVNSENYTQPSLPTLSVVASSSYTRSKMLLSFGPGAGGSAGLKEFVVEQKAGSGDFQYYKTYSTATVSDVVFVQPGVSYRYRIKTVSLANVSSEWRTSADNSALALLTLPAVNSFALSTSTSPWEAFINYSFRYSLNTANLITNATVKDGWTSASFGFEVAYKPEGMATTTILYPHSQFAACAGQQCYSSSTISVVALDYNYSVTPYYLVNEGATTTFFYGGSVSRQILGVVKDDISMDPPSNVSVLSRSGYNLLALSLKFDYNSALVPKIKKIPYYSGLSGGYEVTDGRRYGGNYYNIPQIQLATSSDSQFFDSGIKIATATPQYISATNQTLGDSTTTNELLYPGGSSVNVLFIERKNSGSWVARANSVNRYLSLCEHSSTCAVSQPELSAYNEFTLNLPPKPSYIDPISDTLSDAESVNGTNRKIKFDYQYTDAIIDGELVRGSGPIIYEVEMSHTKDFENDADWHKPATNEFACISTATPPPSILTCNPVISGLKIGQSPAYEYLRIRPKGSGDSWVLVQDDMIVMPPECSATTTISIMASGSSGDVESLNSKFISEVREQINSCRALLKMPQYEYINWDDVVDSPEHPLKKGDRILAKHVMDLRKSVNEIYKKLAKGGGLFQQKFGTPVNWGPVVKPGDKIYKKHFTDIEKILKNLGDLTYVLE